MGKELSRCDIMGLAEITEGANAIQVFSKREAVVRLVP